MGIRIYSVDDDDEVLSVYILELGSLASVNVRTALARK